LTFFEISHLGTQQSDKKAKIVLDTDLTIWENSPVMSKLSSEQVAKMLGISKSALSRYILAGKVAAPPETMAGGMRMRLWSESDIEGLRKALPKIANGRKTRYSKLREKQKPQPEEAVPHKSRGAKKKRTKKEK
jgi:predicted DNA-binding transcriptional regulator AlpA